jgi:hypothetical protein
MDQSFLPSFEVCFHPHILFISFWFPSSSPMSFLIFSLISSLLHHCQCFLSFFRPLPRTFSSVVLKFYLIFLSLIIVSSSTSPSSSCPRFSHSFRWVKERCFWLAIRISAETLSDLNIILLSIILYDFLEISDMRAGIMTLLSRFFYGSPK